ncbi:MAG: hypothetical protein IT497_09690 [Ottowia sp.]|nr:hypothetical protein [Ottowia sp.]
MTVISMAFTWSRPTLLCAYYCEQMSCASSCLRLVHALPSGALAYAQAIHIDVSALRSYFLIGGR